MKILMVSMFAPHFFNWTEQLKDSGHEIHWLDVLDSNTKVVQLGFVHQLIGWRFKWNYPGRYFIKKNLPSLNNWINKINEVAFEKKLESELVRIQPDAVHFFVMYISGVKSLNLISKFPNIKWIYSSWGSDMFYYSQLPSEKKMMREILPLVNYMFADCSRDFLIAKKNGFKGISFGPFPGGGGFDLENTAKYIQPQDKRNIILIKGYQGLHGKCISVLKAVLSIKDKLNSFRIIVFGASNEVLEFVNKEKIQPEEVEINAVLPRKKVLKLMGETKIYVGNSSSDGIPNTLLEAIVMGAFPIQSDPGGATSEIIQHKKNGLLISDPEDYVEIRDLIACALEDPGLMEKAVSYNNSNLKPGLERNKVKGEVLNCYTQIEMQS